jgi:ABC-type sugar transport system substrate-binding protein
MVVVHPVDEAGAAPGVERLQENGIPAYIYDFRIGTENYTSNIYHDFDGPLGVNLLGEKIVELVEERGEPIFLLEVWGNRGEQSSWERAAGLHQAIDQCDLITTMESADTMWSDDGNAAAIMDNFTARPELNAFWYMDGGAEGCIEGLRSIDRLQPIGHPDHVLASSITPSSGVIDAMLNKEFDCVGNHQPWDLADVTIKIAFTNVILGQSVPKIVMVPSGVMDVDNILSEQLFGVPLAYALMPMGEWDIWPVMDTVTDPVYDQKADGTLTTYPLPAPTVAMRKELAGY